jgi:hypothetical protein
MHQPHRVLLVCGSATLLIGGCAQAVRPVRDAQAAVRPARPPLGVVEHRGRRHELRDLLDPAYRAASDDEYVRDFDPDRALARRPQPLTASLKVEASR